MADAVIEYVKPIQEKLAKYSADPAYVLDVLRNGTEKLKEQAEATTKEVREKLGLELNNVQIYQKLKANV